MSCPIKINLLSKYVHQSVIRKLSTFYSPFFLLLVPNPSPSLETSQNFFGLSSLLASWKIAVPYQLDDLTISNTHTYLPHQKIYVGRYAYM